MLKSLLIKNFILIKQANLDFTKGFNVLCGETGAGKSIIIKALDIVLGAKTDKNIILDKNNPCIIEAVFENNNKETVISREIASSSKFRLNGILSSSDEIKELRESLIDIHSQHQTYSFLSSKNHINMLDEYIIKKSPQYKELLSNYREMFLEYKQINKKLEFLKENYQNNEKEIEFLKFQLKELDDAQIKQGEEEEIKSQIEILSNAQNLKEETYSSYYALYGDNQSIVEALGKIKYCLSGLSQIDKNLEENYNVIFDAFENLKECANNLRSYSSSLDCDPQKLDELNERLSLIQKLKRKYGPDLDFEYENISKRLNELTNDDSNIEELEKKLASLNDSCNFLSLNIREYRKINSTELSLLIEEKLKTLELKEAKFEISLTDSSADEKGCDKVEFLISTNKNLSSAPLARIASGGEISRVMLALKTIFASVDKVSTIVFDEIDTGISGVASNAVANSILELATSTQVICITHQPIICAKADNFIWISKEHNESTDIKIDILDNESRLKALAQMAGGDVNEKSLEFAKTLLIN